MENNDNGDDKKTSLTEEEIKRIVEGQKQLSDPANFVSEYDKKTALQSAVFNLINMEPFYGGLLQELTVKYSLAVPTAGITYNEKQAQFEIYINPDFFIKKLTNENRVAVFHHEVLHFTNKHLFRLPFMDKSISNEEKRIYNIAGDMAINQYIKNLPKDCVNVADWKLDNGSPFPLLCDMETYHKLIKEENKKQQEKNDKAKASGDSSLGSQGNVPDQLGKFTDFDTHFWDNLDEETKKRMLDEAGKVLRRTIEKTAYSYSTIPDSIKDLLQEIDVLSSQLNYKKILKDAIKKSATFSNRDNTWKKPNKRYGIYSPGTKLGELPKVAFFNDTSGSISLQEQNKYMRIMDQFLKSGARNCILGFWHTNLYYKKPYRLGQEITQDSIESGGTDVASVLDDIKKNKYDLSIILTDGYFERHDLKSDAEVIWIISEGGNPEHPCNHIGKTILLDKLK